MKSNDLNELLLSLSPSEKRYVQIFAEKHQVKGRNNYLRIFELLTAGTEQNESAEEENPFIPEITSSQKSYLYTFILKALRSYHESRNTAVEVHELLINARLLFEKRLYRQCLKILNRAAGLAQRFDQLILMAEICEMKLLIISENYGKDAIPEFDQQQKELDRLIALYPDLRATVLLQQRLRILQRKQERLPEKENLRYKRILKGLLSTAKKSGNFLMMSQSLYAQARLYHYQGQLASSAAVYEELITLWDTRPDRVSGENMQYKKIIFNFLIVCHQLEQFNRFPALINRVHSIPCSNSEEEAEEFQHLQEMKLLLLMNTDEYDQLPRIEKEISEGFLLHRNKISKAHELAFYHNIAIAYFICENWKASLSSLEKIIQQKKTQQRLDLQYFARILRLVIFYEMRKFDLLEYETINTERYLRKNKSWTLFESCITKLLEKLPSVENGQKKILFEKAARQLLKVKENPKTWSRIGFDEIHYWINSRIECISVRKALNLGLKK